MTIAVNTVVLAAAASHAQAQVPVAANAATEPAESAPGATLPEVVVRDTQGESSARLVGKRTTTGTKTDTPIDEIPQTINIVTAAQVDMTGATDLNEALRYVPGFSSFGSDSRTDGYAVLRGFTPTLFIDGLQTPNTETLANWRVDPYMVERITVLRGPTSVLYGAGDPGAIVDATTSQADGTRVREVGVQLGNYARKQAMLDLGDTLDADGKYAYRFLGVARDGNASTGPNVDQRVALAPSFRWRPSASTSLTFAATYLQDRGDISYNFLPAQGTVLPNPNGALSPDVYMGDPTFNHYRKKQASFGYQLSHEVDSIWTLRQNLRWMHLSGDDGSVFGVGLAPSSLTEMTRYAGLFDMNYSRFDIDNNAQARFGLGSQAHTVLLGFQYNRQTATESEWLAQAPYLDLYRPVYTPVTTAIFSGPTSFGHTDTYTAANTFALYLQDQVEVGRWTFTLGGREDWVDMREDNRASGVGVQQSVSAFSGRVGLAYQGDYGVSPYVSYATSFNPVIGAMMTGGGLAKPTRGEQVETGLRWRPGPKDLVLSAAVYQIDQTNVLTPAPTNLDPSGRSFVQTGKVRSRGIELNAVGKLTRALSIIASYVYQDVKNVAANDASLNHWPVDVPRPRQIASLWADWTWHTGPLAGVGIGAGVRYQSALAGAPDNSLTIASYTLYDAALRYEIRNWRFALNVKNVFDRRYVSGCQSYAVCVFGNERTVLATAKYDW